MTIRLLISQLSTVKSALNHIQDWTKYNLTESQAHRLGNNLDTTLDGCKVAMEALADDVRDLVGIDPKDSGTVRTVSDVEYHQEALTSRIIIVSDDDNFIEDFPARVT